jgi:rubrerythrin
MTTHRRMSAAPIRRRHGAGLDDPTELMDNTRFRPDALEPDGRVAAGTAYYGTLGEIARDPDEDLVQCHLCGRWFRQVGGSHLRRTHGWTLAEYRIAFQLPAKAPLVAEATSEMMRRHRARRIAAGELSAAPPVPPPTDQRRFVTPGRSLPVLAPDLADELHPTRNAELDPFTLGRYSKRFVWWRCGSCGHDWQTTPQSRSGGNYGCPRCAITRRAETRAGPSSPAGSLASRFPAVAAELRDLDPSAVSFGSPAKVWWRCQTCGHEWRAAVKRRTGDRQGCPRCAQRLRASARRYVPSERSLAARDPGLARQFMARNELGPEFIGTASRHAAWWHCGACGHEWRTTVRNRIRNPQCPACRSQPNTNGLAHSGA